MLSTKYSRSLAPADYSITSTISQANRQVEVANAVAVGYVLGPTVYAQCMEWPTPTDVRAQAFCSNPLGIAFWSCFRDEQLAFNTSTPQDHCPSNKSSSVATLLWLDLDTGACRKNNKLRRPTRKKRNEREAEAKQTSSLFAYLHEIANLSVLHTRLRQFTFADFGRGFSKPVHPIPLNKNKV